MTDIYLILEHTTRCNLDCRYCYNIWKDAPENRVADLKLLDFNVAIQNISNSARIGGVTHAGGEPLLNPDLKEIIEACKSRGIPQSMTSNGVLINEQTVIELKTGGVSHVEISLPSLDNSTYNALCGKESLSHVRKAILYLKKHGLKCSVSSVVTRLNSHEINDLIETAAAFGADYFLLNRFIPGGRGKSYQSELALNPDELRQVLEIAGKASAYYRLPVTVPIPVEHCVFDTEGLKNLHFGTCGCGLHKWVLDPEANLRICEQHPEVLGSLLSEGFDLLSRKKETEDFRKQNLKKNCEDLPCYSRCGGGCRFALTSSSA